MLKKQKETKAKKDKLLGKRKKPETEEDKDIGDFFANTEIEIVPQEKFKSADDSEDGGYSSMDSEDMAETRALAKVMLRKKGRQ